MTDAVRILGVDCRDWIALKDCESCQNDHDTHDKGEDDKADLAKETNRKDTIIEKDNRRFRKVDGDLVVDLELEEVLVGERLDGI
jgi:hypothetical protein